MSDVTLSANQLAKHFGDKVALDHLDLAVSRGEIVGLLGPNGAGKTTTMKLFLGLLRPTHGHAEVLGLNALTEGIEVKRHLGFVADEPGFYDFLTGRETIAFVSQVRGLEFRQVWQKLDPLVADLDFNDELDRFVSGYSHGMKKKLALLLALAHAPEVLLLDEPTNGLDPEMAVKVRDLLTRLAAAGTTILISTHLLEMADRLCPRVALLHHGRLVAFGDRHSIREQAGLPADASLESAFLALTRN